MKPLAAFIVSVSRGALISGILIYLLPALLGGEIIWFAMPITELIVSVYVCIETPLYNFFKNKRTHKALSNV